MSKSQMRFLWALVLANGFASLAIAQDPPELSVRLEPGAVLRYKGEGKSTHDLLSSGRPEKTTRGWKVDSLVFVLSVESSGRARIAMQDLVETSCVPPCFPSYSDCRVDLGYKSFDGSQHRDEGRFPLHRDTLAALLLGPEALPDGPARAGMTWKAPFSIPRLSIPSLEAEFRLVALEGEGGGMTARICADLGAKKNTAGNEQDGQGDTVELRAGSFVEYEVAVATGIARKCRISLLYGLNTASEKAEASVDFTFELQPRNPPNPACASGIGRALDILDAGDYEKFELSLMQFVKQASGTDWETLASGLLSGFFPVAIETLRTWSRDANGCYEVTGDGERGGPPPLSFDPSLLTFDLGGTRVSQVLDEIWSRTGNRVPVSRGMRDVVLSGFKAENEPFWSVMDRLCGVSGNDYGFRTVRGGG